MYFVDGRVVKHLVFAADSAGLNPGGDIQFIFYFASFFLSWT